MSTREKRGQILRQMREQRNIRQKDIADYLEITQQAYQRYEAGTSEPSGDLLCKLADYFQVTTDYLLGRAPQTDAMALLISQTDVSLETLTKQFEALPEEGQVLMMAIIRALNETREIRYAKKKPRTVWIRKHQNKRRQDSDIIFQMAMNGKTLKSLRRKKPARQISRSRWTVTAWSRISTGGTLHL